MPDDRPPDRGVVRPRVKVINKKSGSSIVLDHPSLKVARALLMNAIGTNDQDFYYGLVAGLQNASWTNGQIDETELNFALSVIDDVRPRDSLEAMLAAQMAVSHLMSMKLAWYQNNADHPKSREIAERGFNRVTRTYLEQLKALKRYRTGGEQTVTVQHVTVSDGGQAIVGNVTQPAAAATPQRTATAPPNGPDATPAQAETAKPTSTTRQRTTHKSRLPTS